MGKFSAASQAIESVFGRVAWTTKNIKTFPSNFVGNNSLNTYIRITTISNSSDINLKSISGLVNIDIFTPAGDGPLPANSIADSLDEMLLGKTININSSTVQFGKSSLAPRGIDSDNRSLYRTDFSIPFNYFGV